MDVSATSGCTTKYFKQISGVSQGSVEGSLLFSDIYLKILAEVGDKVRSLSLLFKC